MTNNLGGTCRKLSLFPYRTSTWLRYTQPSYPSVLPVLSRICVISDAYIALGRMNKKPNPVNDADLITDEEEFHSSFRVFLNAVEMLAASPEEQCQLMGNYNVAWELKEDVSTGKYLVGRGFLSEEQESWVSALVAACGAVNTQVLPAGSGLEVNLLAMRHPGWEPLRFLANEVVIRLASFSAQNSRYLGLGNNAA